MSKILVIACAIAHIGLPLAAARVVRAWVGLKGCHIKIDQRHRSCCEIQHTKQLDRIITDFQGVQI
jgi:hypothetical protein